MTTHPSHCYADLNSIVASICHKQSLTRDCDVLREVKTPGLTPRAPVRHNKLPCYRQSLYSVVLMVSHEYLITTIGGEADGHVELALSHAVRSHSTSDKSGMERDADSHE